MMWGEREDCEWRRKRTSWESQGQGEGKRKRKRQRQQQQGGNMSRREEKKGRESEGSAPLRWAPQRLCSVVDWLALA